MIDLTFTPQRGTGTIPVGARIGTATISSITPTRWRLLASASRDGVLVRFGSSTEIVFERGDDDDGTEPVTIDWRIELATHPDER